MPWMNSLQVVYVSQLAHVAAYVLLMASKSIHDCVLLSISSLILINRAVRIWPVEDERELRSNAPSYTPFPKWFSGLGIILARDCM